jgi:hypothetical protein
VTAHPWDTPSGPQRADPQPQHADNPGLGTRVPGRDGTGVATMSKGNPMDPDPCSLAQITGTARLLKESGHHKQASRLLGTALAAYDPDTAPPADDLLNAAAWWCLTTHDGRITLPWAQYLYRGWRANHGPSHPATILAGVILAEAYLDRDDRTAIDVRRNLLTALTEDPLHAPSEGIKARRDLARTLHHFGCCAEAITEATQAFTKTRQVADVVILVDIGSSLVAMLDACGRSQEAAELLLTLTADTDNMAEGFSDATVDMLRTSLSDVRPAHASRCAARQDHIVDDQPDPAAAPGRWHRLTGPPPDHQGTWPVPSPRSDWLRAIARVLFVFVFGAAVNIVLSDVGASKLLRLIVSMVIVAAGIEVMNLRRIRPPR